MSLWHKAAALRDFGPAYVGCGSFASNQDSPDLARMSALRPIATKLWSTTLLFNHLVGADEQCYRNFDANRFGRFRVAQRRH
jgi:hypothetical protein